MKLSRLKSLLFISLANLPMRSKKIRPYLLKKAGVNIIDYKSVLIGKNVVIDSNNPRLITIESKVYITHGCTILTHFLDTTKKKTQFYTGPVSFGENCFLGCNTVICAPVRIGCNSIVAAGSIVTKDIPDNQLWGGVPAKFIKNLNRQ